MKKKILTIDQINQNNNNSIIINKIINIINIIIYYKLI